MKKFQRHPKLVDVRNSLPRHKSKKYARRALLAILYIVRHHSATTSGSAQSFANYHVNTLGWPGIGYHFVIDRNGNIYWCHDLEVISYGVGGHNTPSVNICLVGNGSFTDAQEQSYRELVLLLQQDLPNAKSVSAVKGHNEFPNHRSNSCPGIDMNFVRSRLSNNNVSTYTPTVVRLLKQNDRGAAVITLQKNLLELGEKLPRFGADGHYGQETVDAVKAFQARHNLTVDGIAGPSTLAKIDELLNNRKYKSAKIIYKGQSVTGVNIDGKVHLQIRQFEELTKAKIGWDGKKASINGKAIDGIVIDGRTYSHVRKAGELLGLNVIWHQETQTVYLKDVS